MSQENRAHESKGHLEVMAAAGGTVHHLAQLDETLTLKWRKCKVHKIFFDFFDIPFPLVIVLKTKIFDGISKLLEWKSFNY